MFSTRLCDVLGTEYPILQSGMGGVAGPDLVAEVCNAGGLGILAGVLTPPEVLRAAIRAVRDRTDRPFGVNLLLLDEVRSPLDATTFDPDTIATVHRALAPLRTRLGLPLVEGGPRSVPALVRPCLDVVLEEGVAVLSCGLGDPGPALNAELHAAGVKVVVMVTNAADARTVEANGADVVIAQGVEAGGHRSHFTKPAPDRLPDVSTLALVGEVVDAVSVPVVAAGGIVDGKGLLAALALGADGVLLGTRFLLTRESTAPEPHKKRLLEAMGADTVLTDAVSGRYARLLRNELTQRLGAPGVPTLPFPSQIMLSADIRAAAESDDAEALPLWAGQAAGRLQDLPWAADVVADLVAGAIAVLDRDLPARLRRSASSARDA